MRRLPGWVRWAGWMALAFLYLPLAAVALYSFNASRTLVWHHLTLEWYRRLLVDLPDNRVDGHALLLATGTSLLLALISTLIATTLGTTLALGLRWRWPRILRLLVDGAVLLPVVTPDLILAAAMVALRQVITALQPGMTALIIAHATFQVSFVALVVLARLAQIGSTQEEAARDLYACELQVLSRVLLPQLLPAIAGGALLAFTLSLDDFVISFFTASPTTQTLPLLIQSSIKRGMAPEIEALSTLVVVATVLLVVGLARLGGLSRPVAAPAR